MLLGLRKFEHGKIDRAKLEVIKISLLSRSLMNGHCLLGACIFLRPSFSLCIYISLLCIYNNVL